MSEEGNGGAVDVRELVRWAERTQRNLEFLAAQQAQFSADLQRSKEEQEERWRKADARWAETERGIRGLLAIAEIHEREIEALKDSQERTQRERKESQAQTGRQVKETGERRDGGSKGREG